MADQLARDYQTAIEALEMMDQKVKNGEVLANEVLYYVEPRRIAELPARLAELKDLTPAQATRLADLNTKLSNVFNHLIRLHLQSTAPTAGRRRTARKRRSKTAKRNSKFWRYI